MSRTHAQIDLRRPFYPAHDEEDGEGEDGSEGEDEDYGGVESHATRRHFETNDDAMGMLDEDEEVRYGLSASVLLAFILIICLPLRHQVDLEGYEQYLAELKSRAEARPQSARVVRSMPAESPQFYLVNAHNPSFPAAPPPANPRPARPLSARPHLSSSSGSKSTSSSSAAAAAPVNQAPRAPQPASRASIGVRRKRQQGGDNFVNARVRAIYHDTGRSTPVMGQMPSSVSATATIANKLKIFQQAELHDEYYKLVDVVTELKTACQQEQERRVKVVSRIRRLEEIVAMKDRKIESLLHAKSVGSDHSHLVGAITQREVAQRDRQNNALLLKLKHKIAQQAQIISSYEEAMQSLRSGIKATNLMELEEERSQLYLELRNLQELLGCARLESESQAKKVSELFQIEDKYRQQLAKLQQENKKRGLEKQKCDQELAFLNSRIDQLQEKLVHEQRKRAYDWEVSSGDSDGGGGGSHLISPSRSSVLASALEEMKELMKKECMVSIQREKLKSPRPSSSAKSPRYTAGVTTTTANYAPVAAQPPATAQPPSQRMARPQSAGPTRPHRTMVPSSSPTTTTTTGKPSTSSSSSTSSSQPAAAPPKSNSVSTSDTPKQSDASDQQTRTNESEKIELREEEREEDSGQTSVDASHDVMIPTSGANQAASREMVAQGSEPLTNGDTLMTPHPNKDEERRTTADAILVDAPAAEMDIVESKNEVPPISEAGDGKSEKEMNTVNDAEPPLDDHSRGSLASQQVHPEVKTTASEGKPDESVESNEEELQRRKIAEVSRLLQEMGDADVDDPALLASDSSEEFLQVAELQREQLGAQAARKSQEAVAAVNFRGEGESESPCSSSSSSSPSEAGSPLPHASLLRSAAKEGDHQEDGETPSATAAPAEPSQESADADAAAAMTLDLQALGLLKGSESQGSGVSASAASVSGSAPSSGELMYDSDFTENENEDGNENGNEGAEDLE